MVASTKAAIFNCQCDQMQNFEGGCETIYVQHRADLSVCMYDGVDDGLVVRDGRLELSHSIRDLDVLTPRLPRGHLA